MHRVVLLHTNDIHGRAGALGRIASVVAGIREEERDATVVWLDAGDVEDTTNHLSNVTKGAAMIRLLEAAGCDAAAVGNASILRYGPQVVVEQAAAVRMPLLVANLREPDGSQLRGARASAMLAGGVGVIGVTATWLGVDGPKIYEQVFGYPDVPVEQVVPPLAAELRATGAKLVVLLSHLGSERDRELARELDGVDVVVGAHSHDLFAEGERHGGVLVVQAGEYGRWIGRVDVSREARHARVIEVAGDTPPLPHVTELAAQIEQEVAEHLSEMVGELASALDWAPDRECGAASFMADVLRERMAAEVAVVGAGNAFTRPLPAGPLRRGVLYDACPSPANPAVTTMSGALPRGARRARTRPDPRCRPTSR